MRQPVKSERIREIVEHIVQATPVLDMHTHLYSRRFGGLLLWGVDELLTYHYLIAEVLRVAPMAPDRFWAMGQSAQADYVWKHLFLERSPISEACRGVLTVLHALGLDVGQRDLGAIRRHFASLDIDAYLDTVFELSGVHSVVMTNDPFDPTERAIWLAGRETDPRFQAALRIDPLLNDWAQMPPRLREMGCAVSGDLGAADLAAVRRLLDEWIERIGPRYLAVSLPPTFAFPDPGPRGRLLEQCVLPAAREANIPFAMMIGVTRGVNPGHRLAADGVGKADITVLHRLCAKYPDNRFLVTLLSRENQHELCVTARKFPNLLIFGCWWFLNNPSLIDEMTRQRLELLGLSVMPQHSDARVLDQLIYKWRHSRSVLARVLADKYVDLAATGWQPTDAEIRRDVGDLLGGVFERFCGRSIT